jgi:hypothetical protein
MAALPHHGIGRRELTSDRPPNTQDSVTRFCVGGRNAPGWGKDAPPTPKAAGERISRTAAPTTVKRVRWSGPNPRVGQALLLPGKTKAWLINRVLVIRGAQPHKPRLDLTVTPVLARDLPDSVRRLDFSRTDKLARAPLPEPRPLDPNRPKPPTLAEQSLAAARRAKALRLAAEAATPLHADEARWDDSEDAVHTRTPKQVRGYRRGDQVGRLHRKNGDIITRDMVFGANAFRCQWDIVVYGLTNGDPLADRVGGSTPGPVLGPRRTETKRAAAERDIVRLLGQLGREQSEMLIHIVANDGTVPEWARAHAPSGKSNSDRDKLALGFLRAVLARVAQYYGFDERRDRVEEVKRAS